MALDFFGLLALILGVLYTVRKLDVRQREPEQFPSVPREAFERWKSKQLGAYNLASSACFGKVIIDLCLVLGQKSIGWNTVRIIGGVVFFLWVAALIVALVTSQAARKLKNDLGIDLDAPRPEKP